MRGKAPFIQNFRAGLIALVRETNGLMAKSWYGRLEALAIRFGSWAKRAAAEKSTPQVSGLTLTLPCFERLPLKALLRRGHEPPLPPTRLSLGQPGFLRRRFKLYRRHLLRVEIFVDQDGQIKSRIHLPDFVKTTEKKEKTCSEKSV